MLTAERTWDAASALYYKEDGCWQRLPEEASLDSLRMLDSSHPGKWVACAVENRASSPIALDGLRYLDALDALELIPDGHGKALVFDEGIGFPPELEGELSSARLLLGGDGELGSEVFEWRNPNLGQVFEDTVAANCARYLTYTGPLPDRAQAQIRQFREDLKYNRMFCVVESALGFIMNHGNIQLLANSPLKMLLWMRRTQKAEGKDPKDLYSFCTFGREHALYNELYEKGWDIESRIPPFLRTVGYDLEFSTSSLMSEISDDGEYESLVKQVVDIAAIWQYGSGLSAGKDPEFFPSTQKSEDETLDKAREAGIDILLDSYFDGNVPVSVLVPDWTG